MKSVNPKGNQSWIFIGRTDAEAEAPILWPPNHWKRSWCWERLKAGGGGDDRGWGGWMVSLTQWTWVWGSSGRWWWIVKPGVLQSVGSQRVRPNWATEQQQQLSWLDRYFFLVLNQISLSRCITVIYLITYRRTSWLLSSFGNYWKLL